MTVTDDARAIAVWQKIQEAQLRINEATKIMSYMFEQNNTELPPDSCAFPREDYITEEDAEVCEE